MSTATDTLTVTMDETVAGPSDPAMVNSVVAMRIPQLL